MENLFSTFVLQQPLNRICYPDKRIFCPLRFCPVWPAFQDEREEPQKDAFATSVAQTTIHFNAKIRVENTTLFAL